MEEKTTKQLFRRFVLHAGTGSETEAVISLLQTSDGRQWFGEVMDEAEQQNDIEMQEFPDHVIEMRWQKLLEKISESGRRPGILRHLKTSHFLLAASLAGILLLAGFTAYFLRDRNLHIETAFGEIKTITLPDGSEVTLNGNSKLSYPKKWQPDIREVSLAGEANFKIVKTVDHQRFVVKMAGTGEIEVLGTEFNVKSRGNDCDVMLRSGSVKLKIERKSVSKEVLMKPGELVKISAKTISRKTVAPAHYDSWTTGKLIFENTTLAEIARMLKEIYNLEVKVADLSLLDRRISGSAPIKDIDVFLNALSISTNLKISRKGSLVTVTAVK